MLTLIAVYYMLYVIVGLAGLALASRDAIQYDYSTISLFIDAPLYAVGIWLMVKRLKAARTYLIVVNFVDFGMDVFNVITGEANIVQLIFDVVFYSLIALYLVKSKKVRIVLCRDYTTQHTRDAGMPSMRSYEYWRDIIMYFCIFAVVGHWMEAGFCTLVSMGWVQGSYNPNDTQMWRDWLYPYTIEGFGFVMCAVVLYPVKTWLEKHIQVNFVPVIISFLINTFACTAIEFVMGLAINADLSMWDYSNMFGNIMGQVCLQNSLGFGVVSTVMVWFIYPYLELQVQKVPPLLMNIIAGLIIVGYASLHLLYIVNPPVDLSTLEAENALIASTPPAA